MSEEAEEHVRVGRKPILLNQHTVMLVSLFRKKFDDFSDVWAMDYVDGRETQIVAAEELLAQLEGEWTPAFLMALRKGITRKLAESDEKFGTSFATEDWP